MMPGDIPCNARCSWRWCRYWSDGHCQDNCTCEKQTQSDTGEPDERDYGELDNENETKRRTTNEIPEKHKAGDG